MTDSDNTLVNMGFRGLCCAINSDRDILITVTKTITKIGESMTRDL